MAKDRSTGSFKKTLLLAFFLYPNLLPVRTKYRRRQCFAFGSVFHRYPVIVGIVYCAIVVCVPSRYSFNRVCRCGWKGIVVLVVASSSRQTHERYHLLHPSSLLLLLLLLLPLLLLLFFSNIIIILLLIII